MIVLLITILLNAQVGIGTVFSSEDRYNPNPSEACTGKILKDNSLVVAHRELPCGSLVTVCNVRTKLCVSAKVTDRGPFGVTKGNYTSVVDMTPFVAKKIKHNGMEPVVVFSENKIENKKPKIRKRSPNT
jgi:hypothetical protein